MAEELPLSAVAVGFTVSGSSLNKVEIMESCGKCIDSGGGM